MKKTLLSVALAFGAFFSATAQNFLTFDGPIPTSVEAGTSITIDFTYQSPAQGAQFQIFLTDVPGIFGGDVAVGADGGAFPTLAEATTPTASTATINVGNLTPSADLPEGQEYRIFGKLADDTAFLLVDNAYPVIEITASTSGAPLNSITFDGPVPTTVEAGSSITLEYTYVSQEQGSQFEIFLTDVPGIFGGQTAEAVLGGEFPTLTAVTEPTAGTVTITVPAGVTPSADLPEGQEYRIFGKLADDSDNWSANGAYPIIEITAPTPDLSVSEFSRDSNEVYFNSTSNSLVINTNVSRATLNIFDITGKIVLELANPSNSDLDLSFLPSGLYIARIGNQFLKFVK